MGYGLDMDKPGQSGPRRNDMPNPSTPDRIGEPRGPRAISREGWKNLAEAARRVLEHQDPPQEDKPSQPDKAPADQNAPQQRSIDPRTVAAWGLTALSAVALGAALFMTAPVSLLGAASACAVGAIAVRVSAGSKARQKNIS